MSVAFVFTTLVQFVMFKQHVQAQLLHVEHQQCRGRPIV